VESLLNTLRLLTPETLHQWYIQQVIPFLTHALPWPPPFLLLDTIPVLVEPEAKRAFPGASWDYRRTKDGKEEDGFGYQVVVLGFPIGQHRCGVLAAQVRGLSAADLDAGRDLLAAVLSVHPDRLRGLPLLMDRAFLDAAWLATLKNEYGIDAVLPLKANMDRLDFMRALVIHEEQPAWETVPDKPRRRLCFLDTLEDWGGHQVPLVGCYIEDQPAQGGRPVSGGWSPPASR
jgi:hypothetical protein